VRKLQALLEGETNLSCSNRYAVKSKQTPDLSLNLARNRGPRLLVSPASPIASRASTPTHFVTLPLDSEGHLCRMRGERVRNVQDARKKLAQKFAHSHGKGGIGMLPRSIRLPGGRCRY
jgi:hypothetical protein